MFNVQIVTAVMFFNAKRINANKDYSKKLDKNIYFIDLFY